MSALSLVPESGVTSGDRLSFTIFVAIALHALIILHDFIHEDPEPAPFTMEITLSRFEDEKQPDKADFLAQSNQQGSGQQDEKARLTSPVQSAIQHTVTQTSAAPPPASEPIFNKDKAVIVTKKSERSRPSLFDRATESTQKAKPKPIRSMLERSLEIAELEASLDNQLRNYAKRPRVTRLTAASTMKAIDARYVESVVAKIERVGKTYFPEEGGKKLYGKPRISISIYSDGSIREIKVLQSSGNLVLDSKTIDIVRRSSPFAPFPKEVRKERDVLELIRTFSYNRKGVSSY